MDKKTILTAFITAIVVAAGSYMFNRFTSTVEAGVEAQDRQAIQAIIDETLRARDEQKKVTINGDTKTVAEALSMISTQQTVIITKVNRMEGAMEALTGD